jgi:hypothetical protein
LTVIIAVTEELSTGVKSGVSIAFALKLTEYVVSVVTFGVLNVYVAKLVIPDALAPVILTVPDPSPPELVIKVKPPLFVRVTA